MALARISRQSIPAPAVLAMGGGPPPVLAGAAGAAAGSLPATAGTAGGLATAAGAATGRLTAEPAWIGVGYLLLVAGYVGGLALNAVVAPPEFKPSSGVDAFALFYVVAQGLERFLDPLASWIRGTGTDGSTQQTKEQAVVDRSQALAAAYTSADGITATGAAERAARAQAAIERIRANTAVVMWGVQSGLAMVFAGGVGLFLLRSIGAAGVPAWLDLFLTGIAVGGGSKVLHEIIGSTQASKESNRDPVEVAGG